MQCVLTRDQGALEGTGAVVDIFQLLTRVVCRVQRTERSPMGTLRTRSGVYGRALSADTVKGNNWIHQGPSRAYTERCRVSLRGTRGLLKEQELWWTYSSC
jgi:hypothetical protein